MVNSVSVVLSWCKQGIPRAGPGTTEVVLPCQRGHPDPESEMHKGQSIRERGVDLGYRQLGAVAGAPCPDGTAAGPAAASSPSG